MKFLLFLFFINTGITSYCQPDTPCSCSHSIKINYPKKAEQNGICGEVLIEISKNDSCTYFNPTIKKGLGYGCDEEALRITTDMITAWNKCNLKCNWKKCAKGIITQKIKFECPSEE